MNIIDTTLNYRYNSSLAYDQSTTLGKITVDVDYDSLVANLSRDATLQDTLIAKTRLSDSFGQRLFDYSQLHPFLTKEDALKFFDNFHGITLVPSENSNAILGISITSGFSNLVLHYHTPTDTLITAFSFANSNIPNPSFTRIETDRTGTPLAGYQPYQTFDAGNDRYIQSGSPVITKIDLSNLYNVFDTIDNVLINSAELVIENVESPAGFGVVPAMTLRAINENNQFANTALQADREAYSKYRVLSTGQIIPYHYPAGKYLAVQSDSYPAEPYVAISYFGTDKKYSVFATLFTQNLFNNSKTIEGAVNDKRLKYLALYPYAATFTNLISGTVNRTVFNKDNIKLRLTYTKPTNLDQ
jgi:hypothetical protein